MSDLQWTPGRGSTPQPIGCDRNELILALTQASKPWEKLDIIDSTLKNCGLDPFFEVLDIPEWGILGEDRPEVARRGHENSLIRALVIQAFGKIPSFVEKSKIAELKNHISRNLLTVLKQEAVNGETTLIRWSATIAIRSIWYDEEWQKQGKYYSMNVGIDAPRLEQKIIEEQVNRLISNRPIQRYNYTGNVFSTEYQDYLDFWTYGPTWELFRLSSYSDEYKFLVQQVLNLLSGRGVKYGLKSENNYIVIEESLKLAERIFNQFNFSQILTEISKFLQHSKKIVRDVAVKMLTPHKQKLDRKSFSILEALSFRFIEPQTKLESLTISELEREIVKCKEYKQRVENIFSSALSACGGNTTDLRNGFSSQLNPHQRISFPSEYATRNLFSSQNDIARLLSSFPSEYATRNLFSSQNDSARLLSSLTNDNATDIRSLFSSQLNDYRNKLNQQISNLENQVTSVKNYQNLIRENRQLISGTFSRIRTADSYIYNNLLTSSNSRLIEGSQPSTYEQCVVLDRQLIEFKDLILREVSKVTNNLDGKSREFRSEAAELEKAAKTALGVAIASFAVILLAVLIVAIILILILVILPLSGAGGG